MRPQFEALSRSGSGEYAVHAFERPGHGRTPDEPGDFTFERMLALTVEYLDAVGLDAVHVVGFSDGAILGLLLAMRHPERVRSLVSISANLDPSGFRTEGGGPPGPDTEGEWYARLSPDGPEHASAVLAKLYRLWTEEPHIPAADLARITAPTLIVAADRDSIATAHTLLISESIPDARLCIVPGATHGLLDQKAAFVTQVLQDFLRSVR
ncbi:alpha/beta fold hydrolase [Microbacteriaceae bacterium VKM Ac-2855]|nr:alpha/beta fold hydrolase [Microbacteriaceae bacterium VKM Ac-2855]